MLFSLKLLWCFWYNTYHGSKREKVLILWVLSGLLAVTHRIPILYYTFCYLRFSQLTQSAHSSTSYMYTVYTAKNCTGWWFNHRLTYLLYNKFSITLLSDLFWHTSDRCIDVDYFSSLGVLKINAFHDILFHV